MNTQAQQIAIAEASQGTIEFFEDVWYYWSGTSRIACKDNDPLVDLNAMHELWRTLSRGQHANFRFNLSSVVQRDGHVCGPSCSLSNATASQRAEAILRALDRWTDEPS